MSKKWVGPKLQVDDEFSDHSSDQEDHSSGANSSSTDDEASPPSKAIITPKKKKKQNEKLASNMGQRRQRKSPPSESDDEEEAHLSPKKHQKKQITPKLRVSETSEVFQRKAPKPTAKVPMIPSAKKPANKNNVIQVQKIMQKEVSRLKDKNSVTGTRGVPSSTSGDEVVDKPAMAATKKKKKKTPKAKIVSPPSPSSSSADEDDGPCAAGEKCTMPIERNVDWVQCDGCQDWFHYKCVGLRPNDIDEDEEYYCPICQKLKSNKSKK